MMRKMLLLDGQVFQSAAWNRGMGKYSLHLLQALSAANQYYDEFGIVFTKSLPLNNEVRDTIAKMAPDAKLHLLDLKTPEDPNYSDITKLQNRNEKLLEKFCEDQRQNVQQVDFLILSLFIDQVCSVFPANVRKLLLFYDLIPLQFSKRYDAWDGYKNYLARFKTLLEADSLFTISQTVADDLVVELGINQDRICNIDGAPIERKHQKSEQPQLTLPKRYILMPSGDEIRKNNARAVQGFEKFRKTFGEEVALVITSSFNEPTKQQLNGLSRHVIFTGNVPEAELQWLYNHCEAVLFVPEYEGLGLPILEAVQAKLPVVCSNLTVFNEMSAKAFYYADQFDPESIAQALHEAVQKKGLDNKRKEYPTIEARYTWENTAQKALDYLQKQPAVTAHAADRPRIAVFSPNPNGYSSIGRIVMLLHAELSRYFEVDYYLENAKSYKQFSRPSYLPFVAQTFKASAFNAKRYADYDAVLYHIGNSEYHLETIKHALHLPGYTIVHDTHLKNIFEGELNQYGYVSRERALAEQKLDTILQTSRSAYLTSLVNAQRGVVVHSSYASKAVTDILVDSGVSVRRINLPTATPVMTKLKLDKQFNIGFAGIINEAKGLDVLEKIIDSPSFSDTHIHIFGIPITSEGTLQRLKSYPTVTLQTNLTDFEFRTVLAQLDALVSYRPQYRGESSQSVIDAMRFGVVPVVRKIGWFDELPDDSVMKANSMDEVVKLLDMLRTDTKLRMQMSDKARELIRTKYSYGQYAQNLADYISNSPDSKHTVNERLTKALKNKQPLHELELILKSG